MRKILNKTRFLKYGVTKKELYVPEYDDIVERNKRSVDQSMRYAEEIRLYNSCGGKVVFATFTYNDSHIPRLPIHKEDGTVKFVSSFSRLHKERYLNSLRCYLYDNFPNFKKSKSSKYTLVPEELPFRYTWCSELGSDGYYLDDRGELRKATNRPHYHCLFFFPPTIVSQLGDNPRDYKWLLGHLWHYGMVRWSDEKKSYKYPIFVDSDFAARYVSKYCNKELNYYKDPDVQSVLYDCHGKLKKDLPEDLKVLLPFHHQSNHMGESLKEKYNSLDDIKNGIYLHSESDLSHGVNKLYKIPQYIFRKKFMIFDRNENRYKYTEYGKNVAIALFKDRINDFASNFFKSYGPSALQKKLSSVDISKEFSYTGSNDVFDLFGYITSTLSSKDRITEYFIYNTVYSGRTVPREKNWNLSTDLFSPASRSLFNLVNEQFDDLSHEDFIDVSLDLYAEQFNYEANSYDIINDVGVFSHDDPPEKLYNDITRFAGFDDIFDTLTKIDSIYCHNIVDSYNDFLQKSKLYKLNVS